MSPTDAPASLGPLIRLRGIATAQLPAPTEAAAGLAPFLISILQEAVPFIDGAAPKTGSPPDPKVWKHKGDKKSPDSAAKVEVSERVIGAGELETVASRAGITDRKLEGETWMCRRSVHADAPETGTASWAEFEKCFRDEHAEAEDAFTPNVLATHEALAWDCGGVEAVEGGETWARFALKVEEMRHRIGKPLKDRTFPVLQMVAAAKGKHEFLVASIPVPDFGTAEQSKLAREKGAQVGVYVSVERVRKLEDGKIEWLMATASDAGGVLPMWVQNMAMPGVVWKDVPLFLGWLAKERTRKDVARVGPLGKGGNGKEGEAPEVTTGTQVTNAPEVSTANAIAEAPQHPDVTTGAGVEAVPYASPTKP
ncbi:hypothetical protein BJ170DRAFT_602113 [Xylariales sp. AK1849]|nr:hypothetical protein BJ170DRAFT_602113 [Xylariales sp. AK1849]